jgi:PEP-CTERM motif
MCRLASALLMAASVVIATPDVHAGPLNADFESGSFFGWTTLGNATIETSAFGSGPSSGVFQASLRTVDFPLPNPSGVASRDTVEAFLGLPAGTLQSLPPTELVLHGSAIKQSFSANAGDILTVDWNFVTDTPFSPPFSGFNDFSIITLNTDETVLADALAPSVASSTVHLRETGFQTSTFIIPTTGTITLGFGVFEVGGAAFQSRLLVDNVAVVSAVPEPSSLALIVMGMSGFLTVVRRRNRRSTAERGDS